MKRFLPLLVLILLAGLPFIGLSSYVMHIAILVLMWSVIGMGWNILGGYTGQVSFGHAAFFGMGAYTAGILYFQLGISAWWGLPACVAVLIAVSLVIGFICLRLRGAYFALATLALGEICRVAAENLVRFTQGNMGIMIKERTWIDKTWYFYIILAIATGSYILIKAVMESKWGYYFVAIREDQDAAESLGIDTTFYKTISLCLSGVMTGIAGAFYMNYMGYIDPSIAFPLYDISIVTVMVVMVGGAATYWGPVIGAVIMVFLAEEIRSLPYIGAAHQTIFGIILILIIMYLPNGIVGDFRKLMKPFVKKRERNMSLIEVNNVSKQFGGIKALNDLSFVLNKGEILGLIGPNGSGKTTLFNVINGFYSPTRGDVYLHGAKVTNLKPHVLCRLGVARTFQVVRPLQRMTVFDNVLASAFVRTTTKAQAETLVVDTLKYTNLYGDRDVQSKRLPLGKRKRLEIARALATQPEILLLDESFAGLNPTEINEQIEIVNSIRTEREITILIIEHHMKVIMSISDRIVVLNYGRKIAEGTPDEIGHNPVVIEAYLGEEVCA